MKRVLAALLLVFGLLTPLAAGCSKRSEDPYWKEMTRIDLEFYDKLNSHDPSVDKKTRSVWKAELMKLRRDAVFLAHPGYANRYHEIKVEELEKCLTCLPMLEMQTIMQDTMGIPPNPDPSTHQKDLLARWNSELDKCWAEAQEVRKKADEEKRRLLS
jgi:hypothetical protein